MPKTGNSNEFRRDNTMINWKDENCKKLWIEICAGIVNGPGAYCFDPHEDTLSSSVAKKADAVVGEYCKRFICEVS